ncbi:hypothetical protein CBS63078_4147 [Aspergillus niger]|nr:hypothetical protein CBS115989_9309 [Aspergillus niger]KAI2827683.1 hypothetical protein CBS133816_6285 [Aspergillus niger]KAI2839917.1 hypothetical protein CBS11350_7255 [Aspergillus niger]KAI2910847.1 hypothetical protein CBS63078_4147 [Aspergillus niger]KAI2939438.1 hypothetical protein CBS147321_6718 [Aspergillus niger]
MLADAKALTFLPQKTLANKGSDETASCNLFRLGARGSAHILQSRPIEFLKKEFSYDLPRLLAEFHEYCLYLKHGSRQTSPEKLNRLYISILPSTAMNSFNIGKALHQFDDESHRYNLRSTAQLRVTSIIGKGSEIYSSTGKSAEEHLKQNGSAV